jgi:hypothetical protein
MAVTIYLRDGRRLDVFEATAVAQDFIPSPSGLLSTLVCRDQSGAVVAQFDRASVLGYRRPRSENELKSVRDSRREPVEHLSLTVGAAAE